MFTMLTTFPLKFNTKIITHFWKMSIINFHGRLA